MHLHLHFDGPITVNVHHHGGADPGVAAILERLTIMSAAMDALTAQVERTKGVAEAAIVLLNGLRQQIIDAGVDQAKLTELTNTLKAETDDLAAAVETQPPTP